MSSPSSDFTLDLILRDTTAFVRRFVVLTPEESVATALWIVHTYALEATDVTPYLLITSAEMRSGKSRLVEVLQVLVARPWKADHTTTAVLAYRMNENPPPTLLLDESDAAFGGPSDYVEALRGILNAGYRRGGCVWKMVRLGGDFKPRGLSAFGPKAIAGIGKFPNTVADRGIPIRLKRRSPSEAVESFYPSEVEPEAAELRDRIASWAEPNSEYLRGLRPTRPNGIGDRAQEVWEPLLAIADTAGADWGVRARQAAVALCGEDAEHEKSIGVQLLSDIREAFESKSNHDRLRSSELIDELAANPDAPWGDWRGKKVTAQSIAQLLKPYGIRTRELWINSRKERGYERSQFIELWERYVPTEAVDPVEAVDAGMAAEAASTTPTVPTTPTEQGAPCRYPSHRESYWTNERGQRVCGICHPKVSNPDE
jgi:hypothetical protein